MKKKSTSITTNKELSLIQKSIVSHHIHNLDCDSYKLDALEIMQNLEVKKFTSLSKKNNRFKAKKEPDFTFIDLFAGIGGFRMALQNLGGKCVFTSEWDKEAQNTYFSNYGDYPFGDITLPETKARIPENFDVLCAGFPCQAFSKGGHQKGFEDTRGTLFFDLCEIIEKHKPKYLFLENVANLVSHDKGNTFKVIKQSLDNLGYTFPEDALIFSPEKFGVPILRSRVYIPCVRKDIVKEKKNKIAFFEHEIEKFYKEKSVSIYSILDKNLPADLTEYEERVLNMWNEFYQGIDLKIIGFPIWSAFFKYDKPLNAFPTWKATFIQKNIDLYQRNKTFIDTWLAKHDNLDWCTPTHTKMEWQAGKDHSSLWDCLIQFRPSGVRIKRANRFSTLVAMNHRQIIGKYKRRISLEESKKLQSFPKKYQLNPKNNYALKQLGNSVNVNVIERIFKLILEEFEC